MRMPVSELFISERDEGFGGAGIMSSESGLKTGAGLVRLLTRKSHVSASLARNPEIKFIPQSIELMRILNQQII